MDWQETEYGSVPLTWQILSIGELSKVVTDGAHFSPRPQAFGKYMCSVKEMSYNKFIFTNCKLISLEDFEKLAAQGCQPRNGDILISKDGANCLDLIFVFNQQEELVLLSSIAIVRLLPTCDPYYVRYFLSSPACQYTMRNNFVSGSAIPRVVLKDFKKVSVLIPPLPEQKSIAAVLSSLDDKIDLLHRQNQTLEAMAETLFRQWFVVEAQEDWEEKPLSQIANFLNGLACQKYPPKNEIDKLPVLKIKELSNGISELSEWASTEVKPEYIVETGDVIFSWSASLIVKVWNGGRCILNQHLFKVTSTEFPKWFYLMWCKHHLDEFISISTSHATTMGHIKRGDLDKAMVLVPPADVIDAMSSKITQILNKEIANQKQIHTLATLRDTLLPKLMSGEVRLL